MVLCIIMLPVFAILAIFSAKYRELTKQAFRCVFLKATFRPCDTTLDSKIKTSVVAPFLKLHGPTGRFLYKYFTVFSWIFVLLLLVSTGYIAYGGYNYYLYGNCNGPGGGFCVFDPTGENSASSSVNAECRLDATVDSLNMDVVNTSFFPSKGSGKEILFFGCYSCKYTREAQPILASLTGKLIYVHVPVHGDTKIIAAERCLYQKDQDAFWDVWDQMFHVDIDNITYDTYRELASSYVNISELETCIENPQITQDVFTHTDTIYAVGIYGTPTVKIDDTIVVGPKPERVYKRLMK